MGRKPAVVARKAGDIVLRGFWGKGVTMPAFEQLLQKIRGLRHGSIRLIDFSDNGFNGNFIPGIIDIVRRGARQLNVSDNCIESAAMQQLCNALPEIAQFLEVLDVRFNPCCSDANFIRCLAGVVPDLKFLDFLGVTASCDADERHPSQRYSRPATPAQLDDAGLPRKSGRATPQQPRQRVRSSTPVRSRSAVSENQSWRQRSTSGSRIQQSRMSPRAWYPAGEGS